MMQRTLSAIGHLITNTQTYDVVVVGGGAAGVGVAVALRHAGIENFVVLERHTVGASFDAWPAETRFITPSFPSNSIGMLDLNSIAIGVSPASRLEVAQPTGREYAGHLRGVAQHFELFGHMSVGCQYICADDKGSSKGCLATFFTAVNDEVDRRLRFREQARQFGAERDEILLHRGRPLFNALNTIGRHDVLLFKAVHVAGDAPVRFGRWGAAVERQLNAPDAKVHLGGSGSYTVHIAARSGIVGRDAVLQPLPPPDTCP